MVEISNGMNYESPESIEPVPESSAPMRGQVLKKIYRVWFFRRFLPGVVIELAVVISFLYVLSRVVFIQRVVENALRVVFDNPGAIINFVLFAFWHEPLATKALSFTVLIVVSYLVYKIFQGIIRFILVKENYFGKTS